MCKMQERSDMEDMFLPLFMLPGWGVEMWMLSVISKCLESGPGCGRQLWKWYWCQHQVSGLWVTEHSECRGGQRTVSTTLGVILKVLTIIPDTPVCFQSSRYCVNHFILFFSLNPCNDPVGGGLLLLSSWMILSPWWRNQSLERPTSLDW